MTFPPFTPSAVVWLGGCLLGLGMSSVHAMNTAADRESIPMPTAAVQATASSARDDAQAQAALSQLRSSVDKKQLVAAGKSLAALSGHPLEAYGGYLFLQAVLDDPAHQQDIARYLRRFTDTSWAESLGQQWADALAKRGDWAAVLRYQTLLVSARGRCHVLNALRQQRGDGVVDEDWLQEATQLWQGSSAELSACAPVVERLYASGSVSEAQWRERLFLWLQEGKSAALVQAQPYLPGSLQALAQLAVQLQRHPEQLAGLLQQPVSADSARLFVRGIYALLRKSPETALPLWESGKTYFGLHALTAAPVEKALFTRLARKQPEKMREWLERIHPAQHDEESLLPLIRLALESSSWEDLLRWLDWMPEGQQQQDIWRYWRARALEALAQDDGAAQAQAIYRDLAGQRSFYGFMAADRLQLPYQLNTLLPDPSGVQAAAATPLGQRLQALYRAGLKEAAWKEWTHARQQRRVKLDELPAYAQNALDWGWHAFSVLSLGHPLHWDYVTLRFPMPWQSLIERKSAEFGIANAWTYGIMRRESAYMTDAKSRSGAMGLMQLMPKTAKALEPIKKISQVYEPEFNVHLGTKLLGQLQREFGGNRILATASYNAGGFRVRQWIPKDQNLPADQWIELIPFKETRDYVKAVTEYSLVFERLADWEQTRVSQYLQPVGSVQIVRKDCDPDKTWCL